MAQHRDQRSAEAQKNKATQLNEGNRKRTEPKKNPSQALYTPAQSLALPRAEASPGARAPLGGSSRPPPHSHAATRAPTTPLMQSPLSAVAHETARTRTSPRTWPGAAPRALPRASPRAMSLANNPPRRSLAPPRAPGRLASGRRGPMTRPQWPRRTTAASASLGSARDACVAGGQTGRRGAGDARGGVKSDTPPSGRSAPRAGNVAVVVCALGLVGGDPRPGPCPPFVNDPSWKWVGRCRGAWRGGVWGWR